MSYNIALFDFDFTLADASAGIIESAQFAARSMGIRVPGPDEIRRTIGMTLAGTYAALANDDDAVKAKEFVKLFVSKADEVMTKNTVFFPDALETLARLQAHGVRTGIVTSKFRYRIEDALTRENSLHLAEHIVGFEDVTKHKPDPESIWKAADFYGAREALDKILFVGDSLFDAEGARNAGVPFAAVLNGTTPRADFMPLPHVLIADSLTEILDFILEGESPCPSLGSHPSHGQ